ncbi:hypothetical protein [Microcoleus sp. S13_C5]|uniref:hypothetical protein n=1 Tax=Microcoleus sp. S13_C5 TaxID=3055411 RepID=UPI002FD43A33
MIFVPPLASSAAKPVGDFLDRQMNHRLRLNKSSPQLMSAIAAKFDLAFQALPYPTLREPLREKGELCYRVP